MTKLFTAPFFITIDGENVDLNELIKQREQEAVKHFAERVKVDWKDWLDDHNWSDEEAKEISTRVDRLLDESNNEKNNTDTKTN